MKKTSVCKSKTSDIKIERSNNNNSFTHNRQEFHFKIRAFPHFIKYMGSKTKILDFIIKGINEVYQGGGICDLFSGSCSLAGALGNSVEMYSNDIQEYSSVLANAYLIAWKNSDTFVSGEEILFKAKKIVEKNWKKLPQGLSYKKVHDLSKFNTVEKANQELLTYSFSFDNHLFTKYYSGTWWSAYQCLWIDAIRQIAEAQKNQPHYNIILASLMYAMAYCSQGTGHYAQYRDGKTLSSMEDILIYRCRGINKYFLQKYESVCSELPDKPTDFKHDITSQDYKKRLSTIPKCTVYADPPYCSVHYSRFYHALETFVLYDYPKLQVKGDKIVKGRYRNNRHQSPFCIQTQVSSAFKDLFSGVASSGSNLVLSYSNNGVLSFNELTKIAKENMRGYQISKQILNLYTYDNGRKNDRDRKVKESF